MELVPNVSEAVRDFRELISYGRESPHVLKALSDFLKSGTPPFRADVDFAVAETTGHADVVYQLVDSLHALLVACRAGNAKTHHLPESAGHGELPFKVA